LGDSLKVGLKYRLQRIAAPSGIGEEPLYAFDIAAVSPPARI
jgi:hypothetical protein